MTKTSSYSQDIQSNEETNIKTDKDVVLNSNRCYEENKIISQQVTAVSEVDL